MGFKYVQLQVYCKIVLWNASHFGKVLSILVILTVWVLFGCQSLATRVSLKKAEQRGSTIPRNLREQLMFDYFQYLQAQRYEEAHQLLALHLDPIKLDYSTEQHRQDHHALTPIISIGKEEPWDIDDTSEDCDYIYEVYAVVPGSFILRSGSVGLVSHPEEPEICLVYVNKAFGSLR